MAGKNNPEKKDNKKFDSWDLEKTGPQTALEKAQDLAWQAMDAATRKESIALAREALKISPDCADAYTIMAQEYAVSYDEALYYYQAGVAAGKRALGEDFKKFKGLFWGELTTRPYMRAVAGLAECLWKIGKQQESIDHLQDLLKLNPDDNQGNRYTLAAHLLEIGKIEDLKKLLTRYREGTAAWIFTKALLIFMDKGDTPEARQALASAARYNPYVIPYLSGRKKIPAGLPDYVGFGDNNEAVSYAAAFKPGWLKVAGALEWLNTCFPPKLRKTNPEPDIKGIPDVFLKAFDQDKEKGTARDTAGDIYLLKVGIKYEPSIWRKIEIKGSQSLQSLQKAIVKAFGLDDNQPYTIFVEDKALDSTAAFGPPYAKSGAHNSARTRIDSLGLKVKSKFLYVHGYGDNWEYPITVLAVHTELVGGKYPRVVESKGEPPSEYPDEEDLE
jgi:tetratricopeptide (TPR) repeat protein